MQLGDEEHSSSVRERPHIMEILGIKAIHSPLPFSEGDSFSEGHAFRSG